MTISDCEPVCTTDCEWVFDRVRVWHVATGGSRVEWQLHSQFLDPTPHSIQLQVGRTAVPAADDWTNVGLPVTNANYAVDDSQRLFGKTPWTHYRLQLTTPLGVYYSKPESVLGSLSRSDWLKWKNNLRQWDFQLRHGPGGQEGFLLKRRLYGERCSCLDTRTLEIKDPQHLACFGTGFTLGYFEPMGCIYAELGLRLTREKLDGQRGTTNDLVVGARMLAVPQLMNQDVWVDKDTDIRYFISDVQHTSEIRGVPVSCDIKLKPAPLSHVIYQFPIPGINA